MCRSSERRITSEGLGCRRNNSTVERDDKKAGRSLHERDDFSLAHRLQGFRAPASTQRFALNFSCVSLSRRQAVARLIDASAATTLWVAFAGTSPRVFCGRLPQYKRFHIEFAHDRARSSVRPSYPAFSEASGPYVDLRTKAKSHLMLPPVDVRSAITWIVHPRQFNR